MTGVRRTRSNLGRRARLVGALAGLILAGCDQFTTFQRLGVSADEGSIRIHYLACDYEEVIAVRLLAANDPGEDEDNEVLWEIRIEEGGSGGTFEVGSQPDGFVEVVQFSGSLSTGDLLIAAVELEDSVGAAIDFRVDDLEAGRVRTIGRPDDVNLNLDAFEAEARDSCEPAQ